MKGMQKAGSLGNLGFQKKYSIEQLLTFHVTHQTQYYFLLVDNPGGGTTTRLLMWLRSYAESLVENLDSSDSDSDSDNSTRSSGSSDTTESSEEEDEFNPNSANRCGGLSLSVLVSL
jgi:hypothetical protein